MIKVRPENLPDFAQVFEVNARAFETEAEAKLVEKLRAIQPHISLLAEIDGQIVGHIFFSPMFFADEKTDFLGLAPMAVLPEFQRQGIGTKLVETGLKNAVERGFTAVFVLGHAGYYPRFGFEIAKTRGFVSEYPVPDEYFMVLELKKDSLTGKQGLIKYCPAFAEI
jgi:putative acetyltransferase